MGAGDVLLVVGSESATFIEATPVGNINTTTIYLKPKGQSYINRSFPADHSRHVGAAADPMISQIYGWCEGRF